jgi:multicomponent Na+:H+ antiporter subunit D
MSQAIPLFVILPLLAAFTAAMAGTRLGIYGKGTVSLLFLLLSALGVVMLLDGQGDPRVYKVGGWEDVSGIPIAIYMVADPLSLIMLLIINTIAAAASCYALAYMETYEDNPKFYVLFCLMAAGMNGVALAGDLFNLFVFLEISVISAYALVAFGVGREELEASFKYQVLGGIASLLIVFGISLLYWHTKTLNMADMARQLAAGGHTRLITFIQVVFIAGFGLKSATIPFHAWLPDAHSSAPSPISAMLSGVLIKAIGIYALLRLFFSVFEPQVSIALTLSVLGAVSMIAGVLLAIGQWDLKRLLAYHSISQMGYVVMAAGLGMLVLSRGGDPAVAALLISGSLYHLINHAAFKSLLFLNAGSIEHRTGQRDLHRMGGLSDKMPITSYTSLGASMAISGIPPFNGFFSKLIIIIAAVKAQFYLAAVFAVLVSIVTLASFMKVQRYAFFGAPGKVTGGEIRESPFAMTLPMVLLALLCLALSLLFLPGIRETVLMPAVEMLTQSGMYAKQLLAN